MPLSLPSDPSLRQLKVLAKDLLKAHKRGDVACCSVLRNLPRLADAEDSAILAAPLSLADVQFAIALDYGFASWAELKGHVGATDRAASSDKRPRATPAQSRQWPEELSYGFRYDPRDLLGNESSVRGAVLRKLVFGTPDPGDSDVFEAHYQDVFSHQESDGTLSGEYNPLNNTREPLRELLQFGYAPDRPEMRRALAAVVQLRSEDPTRWGPPAEDLLAAGKTDHPELGQWLGELAGRTLRELGKGCPGTPFGSVTALWRGRELADVGDALNACFRWMDEAVHPPGCSRQLGLCDPWSIVLCLADVDAPLATHLARRLTPMLLRCQRADGGWRDAWKNDKTVLALRMFARHGLLDELCELPPAPPDWRVVRSTPLPGAKPKNLTLADGQLWCLDMDGLRALALSCENGQVQREVKLEARPGTNEFGFAHGPGVFYLSAFGKKDKRQDMVHELDAASGKVLRSFELPTVSDCTSVTRVGRRLFVCDGWGGGTWVIELDRPDVRPYRVYIAVGMPDYLSSDGKTIWATGYMAPVLAHTNPDGDLLDWGERPFGFAPTAWDGEHLWALNAPERCVSMIEKTESGKEITAALRSKP